MKTNVDPSDVVLASLIRNMCNGPNGSETKRNPYCIEAIKDALQYLASKYSIKDYLDAADVVLERASK